MSFPKEFPKPALSAMMGLLGPDKPSADVIALSCYDILGYGLGLVYGDAKYPMQFDLTKIMQILSLQEIEKVKPALEDYQKLIASGVPRWRAILQLLIKYGPDIVNLILAIIKVA